MSVYKVTIRAYLSTGASRTAKRLNNIPRAAALRFAAHRTFDSIARSALFMTPVQAMTRVEFDPKTGRVSFKVKSRLAPASIKKLIVNAPLEDTAYEGQHTCFKVSGQEFWADIRDISRITVTKSKAVRGERFVANKDFF